MPSLDGRAGTTFAVALSCPIVVGFCIAFVDRGAASLAHVDVNGHDAVFRGLTHMVDPLLPLAALGLAGSALAGLFGWHPGRIGHLLVACCLAVLVNGGSLFRQTKRPPTEAAFVLQGRMRHTEADRELAARHVAEGDARVVQLRDRIADRRSRRFPTELADKALATMLTTLGHMRDHLVAIELDLDGPGVAGPEKLADPGYRR